MPREEYVSRDFLIDSHKNFEIGKIMFVDSSEPSCMNIGYKVSNPIPDFQDLEWLLYSPNLY